MTLFDNAENSILDLIFFTTALPNFTTAINVTLHTTSPGDAGDSTTNEAAYGGYVATGVATLRNVSDWTVTANSVSNAIAITFPTVTGEPLTDITHVAISGDANAGIAWQVLDAPITPVVGDTPQFAIGALTFTID